MTVTEQIIKHVGILPEYVQSEILDYVEFLESKMDRTKTERANWSDLSISQAMRGLESETSPYTLNDVKEKLI